MTKEAIIEEIKKHSPEEQREIVEAVREPGEGEYALSKQQRSELERRYDERKSSAAQGSSWQDVRNRIEGSLAQ
ncbi:MAG: hypothetical protein ACOC0D_10015 [Spirochaeta sp.]